MLSKILKGETKMGKWAEYLNELDLLDYSVEKSNIVSRDLANEELAKAVTEESLQRFSSIQEMSLDDFATSGLVRKVKSNVLDKTVIFAADNAQVPLKKDRVEFKKLVGMPPEQPRSLHTLKKIRD